ncbi:MAG TPA: aldehyde dehydrogenase family protein [Polyangiales bacterium]|nr:aldehyde dehydrogenase family protein [Polyangiales bacterium]
MLQPDSRASQEVADPLFAARPPVTIANLAHGAPQAYAGARIEVFSPYSGRLLGSVPDSGPAQVDDIVRGAKAAAESWARTPIKQRTLPLFRFRELLLSELDALALGAARECGKTIEEAKAGILKGVEVSEFALSLQNLDAGGTMEVSQGVRCEVRREPLGVVAGITPFNFPAMVPLWLFPIAVTLGNTFILKPSEKVPLTGARLGELMLEAGYPAGVFSVLHGGRGAVEALLDHPDVQAYGFVGSSKVAAEVYTRGSAQGKRVLALGGAKNTMILAPDAAPELAIPGVVASFTGCAGQRCMAGSLLVAVGDCDRLIDGIIEKARAMQLPHDMGAIIDAHALQKLESAIERGVKDGATLRLDGRKPSAPSGGHWLAPTVLDNVDPGSFCAQEELFGPVLSIVRVPNLHSALAIEASSRYGNATSVFTQSGQVARLVSDHSTSGMIGINIGVPVPREPFSFGGTKGSRFGHGDITGQGGVEFWTKLKKVTSKWAEIENGSWMS